MRERERERDVDFRNAGILRHMWVSRDLYGYLETYVGILRHNVGISRLSIEYLYILPNDPGTMSGEFRVQNYRLKKKIAEASLAVCILDQLSKYNLTVNADKSEKYEIPRPPAPTPITKMEVLIQQKILKILWSELDWLVNYTPPPIESKEPDWRKCKLL